MSAMLKAHVGIEPGPPMPVPPEPSPAEPPPPYPDPLPQPEPEPPERAAVLLRMGELPRIAARATERRRGAAMGGGIVRFRLQVPGGADTS